MWPKNSHRLLLQRRAGAVALPPRIRAIALSIALTVANAVNASESEAPAARWYTSEQVLRGSKLFEIHCARCHGSDAQGTASWKKRDENGNFPPPPLNGTAHTWHHQLPLLRTIVRTGSISRGGNMPAFDNKLSDAEIDAVIAWLQSHWPDDVYLRWSGTEKPRIPAADSIRQLLPDAAR